MPTKILLADDCTILSKGIKRSLEQEGYEVLCSFDGQEAVDLFCQSNPDLILLDLHMPNMDGMEVCMKIRARSDVPIIILTERDQTTDRLMSFTYGADDYMTKPFNILELKARIRTLLRRVQRQQQQADENILHYGLIELDQLRHTVKHNSKLVELTAREFDLISLLMLNPGRVFNREQLLNQVWGYSYQGDLRTVDVHIRRIREKLETDPAHPSAIMTKWGVGYYLKA